MNYILTFINEQGHPDFSVSPIYQINDVPDTGLEEAMLIFTKIIDALAILQPDRKVSIFELNTIS